MIRNQTIYTVEILGEGDAFVAAHATLDAHPHLPLPCSFYLIAGEEACAALLAHHVDGDVSVSVSRAAESEADGVLAPANVIAAFISHVGRDMDLAFHWDEESHLWCTSSHLDGNYSESDDQEADSEEDAVRSALATEIRDQIDTRCF